jgi:bacteriorhodopsin
MPTLESFQPWQETLNESQYTLVYYFLAVAGFAMLAHFVRTWTTRNEIGPRFRPAIIASLCITVIAALSYMVLIVKFDVGYDATGGAQRPNSDAIFSVIPRYFDWTVTVPLLVVELIAVSGLIGAAARRQSARDPHQAACFNPSA